MASQARTELAAAKLRREKMTVAGVVNRSLVRASLAVAQAALEKTKADISLAALGRQQELTQERLDRTTIRAPQDGKILLIPVHRGELVGGQAPVLQMADTGRMAVIAEVYETDVRRVYEGQRAEVIVRALGGQTLYGNVVRVAGVVGRNQVLDVDPRAAVDRRVVDVKIELDEPGPASRLINHEVRVKLLPSSRRRP
jgi:HlyD family secretion protein